LNGFLGKEGFVVFIQRIVTPLFSLMNQFFLQGEGDFVLMHQKVSVWSKTISKQGCSKS
jgi:hypothetical protein